MLQEAASRLGFLIRPRQQQLRGTDDGGNWSLEFVRGVRQEALLFHLQPPALGGAPVIDRTPATWAVKLGQVVDLHPKEGVLASHPPLDAFVPRGAAAD